MRAPRSAVTVLSFASLALLAVSALAACGSSSSGGTGGGSGDDGRFHPPTDGVAMSESDACDALSNAQSARQLTLMCVATGQTCPDLLRSQFTTACLQYDQGSVQGCIAYYGMATSCDDLSAAIDDCEVAPLAGSDPMGCP